MWKGIDVSDNQGVIDWAQVAASKVAFAILRSVRRSGKEDHQFAANLEGVITVLSGMSELSMIFAGIDTTPVCCVC